MAYLSDTRIPNYSPLGVAGGIALVKRWVALSRERAALRTMTFSQLQDIGVDPKSAQAEAARPFWASDCR